MPTRFHWRIPTVAAVVFVLVASGCGGGDGTVAGPGPTPGLIDLVTFQAASLVIGQPDFASNAINQGGATAANTLSDALGVAVGSGGLFIADTFNNRVLGYTTLPAVNNAAGDVVLGQSDFVSSSAAMAPTAVNFHGPAGVCIAEGRLFMVSAFQSRVLIWHTVPTMPGTPADVALGQSSLTTGAQNTTQDGLDQPEGVCVAGGRIAVADTGNNRVLLWTVMPTVDNGAPASVVLGQATFTTSTSGTSASALSQPQAVWTDGTRVVVADSDNARVLIWLTFPTMNNQPADLVLGQATFTTGVGGNGAAGMAVPAGTASNGTQLFVSDTKQNRVLGWNAFPTTNGQPADLVLGQSDFVNVEPNDDDQDGVVDAAPSARTLGGPTGLAVSANRLYVVDGNQRVLVFGN